MAATGNLSRAQVILVDYLVDKDVVSGCSISAPIVHGLFSAGNISMREVIPATGSYHDNREYFSANHFCIHFRIINMYLRNGNFGIIRYSREQVC